MASPKSDPAEIVGWALPGVLGEIAEAAGTGVALTLAHAYGGTAVWVPKRPTADTQLAQCVGVPGAEAIVRRFGGGARLLIPLGPTAEGAKKHEAIRALLEAGETTPAIARELHCHERTVRRHRAKIRDTEEPPLLALARQPD